MKCLEKQNYNEAILYLAGGFMAFWFLPIFFPTAGYFFSGLIFLAPINDVIEKNPEISSVSGGGIVIIIISGFMAFMSAVAFFGLV